MTSTYRLPREAADRLDAAVDGRRNADAVRALAVFIGRFWSAPGRLGRPFPVDRVALADHPALGLSEARVRGALAALEAIGFIERVEVAGSAYRATEHGLRRRAVQWRFGPEYLPTFVSANRRAQRAGGAAVPARRPITPSIPPRPSVPTPIRQEWSSTRGSLDWAPLLARKDHSAEATLFTGEKNGGATDSRLEAALERLRRAGSF